MIIEVLLFIFFGLINFILSLFTLPGMPSVVLNAINAVIPWITLPVSIIKTYVGDSFFNSLLNLVILVIIFSVSIRPALWLYNKIRGSGN